MVRQTKHPSENDKLRAREQQLKAAKKKRAAKGWKPGEVALLNKLFPNNPTSVTAKLLG